MNESNWFTSLIVGAIISIIINLITPSMLSWIKQKRSERSSALNEELFLKHKWLKDNLNTDAKRIIYVLEKITFLIYGLVLWQLAFLLMSVTSMVEKYFYVSNLSEFDYIEMCMILLISVVMSGLSWMMLDTRKHIKLIANQDSLDKHFESREAQQ